MPMPRYVPAWRNVVIATLSPSCAATFTTLASTLLRSPSTSLITLVVLPRLDLGNHVAGDRRSAATASRTAVRPPQAGPSGRTIMRPASAASPPPPTHPAVDDDAAADPGADGQVDQVSDAAAGAIEVFGQGGDVGVVAEEGGPAKPLTDQGAQRDITPTGQVGRFQHHAGDRVERPGRADARCRSHRLPAYRRCASAIAA